MKFPVLMTLAALLSITPAIAQTNSEPVARAPSQPNSMNPAARAYEAAPPGAASQRDATTLNRGVGTADNGLPIGSPGSGPGSPEQPINSGRHEDRYNP